MEIRINTNKNDFPMFDEKDDDMTGKLYAECTIKRNKDELWSGEITKISSSGIYTVRLIKRLE